MRRNGDLFPVRREQDWGLSPWSETSWFSPNSFLSASPWQTMRRMQEDMDRLFSQFVAPGTQQPGQVRNWAPSVDVSQTEGEWLIEADLPGVSKDHVDVQVHNHHLVIRAEVHEEKGPETEGGQDRQYQRRERRYGRFERVLALPQNVDEERIRCEFRDGVLKVHVPKVAEARTQGRRIPIGDGQPEATSIAAGTEVESRPNGKSNHGAPDKGKVAAKAA